MLNFDIAVNKLFKDCMGSWMDMVDNSKGCCMARKCTGNLMAARLSVVRLELLAEQFDIRYYSCRADTSTRFGKAYMDGTGRSYLGVVEWELFGVAKWEELL